MAIMGIRDTHHSVLSEVGIEPETVEEGYVRGSNLR